MTSGLLVSTIGIEFEKIEKSKQTLKNIHIDNKGSGCRNERNITNKYTDVTVQCNINYITTYYVHDMNCIHQVHTFPNEAPRIKRTGYRDGLQILFFSASGGELNPK